VQVWLLTKPCGTQQKTNQKANQNGIITDKKANQNAIITRISLSSSHTGKTNKQKLCFFQFWFQNIIFTFGSLLLPMCSLLPDKKATAFISYFAFASYDSC